MRHLSGVGSFWQCFIVLHGPPFFGFCLPTVSNLSFSAPVTRSALDPKAAQMATKLDQLDNDLDKTQQDILSLMRAPLNRNDPAGDLAKRLREQEVRGCNSII